MLYDIIITIRLYIRLYVQICCRLRIIRFKLCQFTVIRIQVYHVTAFICWVLRLQKNVPNKKQAVFRQLQRFSKSAITNNSSLYSLARPPEQYSQLIFMSSVLLPLGHLVHILCTKTRINTLNYLLF